MSTQNKNTEAQTELHSDTPEHTHDHGHVHGPNCNHGHHHEALKPLVRETPKIGRNDLCLCGSQKKYKKCCGQ
jgi:uncharacterized protein YecA (UPF0149 family)